MDPGIETFKKAFGCYFNNIQLADAVIQTGEHEFNVHKVVLSAHSPVFRKAFAGEWKEAKEEKMIIEDEPAVVEAMLCYMYNFHYNTGSLVHVRDMPLLFHAQVYALADMYDIRPLKSFARNKFNTTLKTAWETNDFYPAIVKVYTSTPEEDRGLRELVVEISSRNIEALLQNDAFRPVFRETLGFAADVTEALVRKKASRSQLPVLPCLNNCGAKWRISGTSKASGDGSIYCPNCGGMVDEEPKEAWPPVVDFGFASPRLREGKTKASRVPACNITGYISYDDEQDCSIIGA